MSCDPEVTNESARCWGENYSYITIMIINWFFIPHHYRRFIDKTVNTVSRFSHHSKIILNRQPSNGLNFNRKPSKGHTCYHQSLKVTPPPPSVPWRPSCTHLDSGVHYLLVLVEGQTGAVQVKSAEIQSRYSSFNNLKITSNKHL